MAVLESQEEDAPSHGILFFKPMSCLGQIRSHRRDETWSVSQDAHDLWLQEISSRPPR
jgi:hypothetical protein